MMVDNVFFIPCNIFILSKVKSKIFNPLPDDTILASSKFKAFADDNFSVVHMTQVFYDIVENIEGKGENAREKSGLYSKGLKHI